MSVEGSSSRNLRVERRGWVEPLLNAAVVILLIAPVAAAVGWLVIDSILDQF